MSNRERITHGNISEEVDLPDMELICEYRDLMTAILHCLGKGIRQARLGEQAKSRLGTEYMLPGDLTQMSVPNDEGVSHIVQYDRYATSVRGLNESDGMMVVLEHNSVRRTDNTYMTIDNRYRIRWNELVGVYEASVLPREIVSSATSDAELLASHSGRKSQTLMLDHEHTAVATEADGGEYTGFVGEWMPLSREDFTELHRRTEEFGHAITSILTKNG